MDTDLILIALEKYFDNKSDNNKHIVEKSLDQYINYKIKFILDAHFKKQNAERVVRAIVSLNAAPEPPKDIKDINEWLEKYILWFNNTRVNGMKI